MVHGRWHDIHDEAKHLVGHHAWRPRAGVGLAKRGEKKEIETAMVGRKGRTATAARPGHAPGNRNGHGWISQVFFPTISLLQQQQRESASRAYAAREQGASLFGHKLQLRSMC